MPKDRLGIDFVGAGFVTGFHLQALVGVRDADVAAIAIPTREHTEAAAEHWQRSFDLIDGGVFAAEDVAIAEAIQRGLRTGASETFVFGRLENFAARFHTNLDRALARPDLAADATAFERADVRG